MQSTRKTARMAMGSSRSLPFWSSLSSSVGLVTVNDGSNVHVSPGHSNWLEELCMRLTLLSRMLPRFARLMSSRTSGGMLSALTSRVGNFALHQHVSYRVALEETGRTNPIVPAPFDAQSTQHACVPPLRSCARSHRLSLCAHRVRFSIRVIQPVLSRSSLDCWRSLAWRALHRSKILSLHCMTELCGRCALLWILVQAQVARLQSSIRARRDTSSGSPGALPMSSDRGLHL